MYEYFPISFSMLFNSLVFYRIIKTISIQKWRTSFVSIPWDGGRVKEAGIQAGRRRRARRRMAEIRVEDGRRRVYRDKKRGGRYEEWNGRRRVEKDGHKFTSKWQRRRGCAQYLTRQGRWKRRGSESRRRQMVYMLELHKRQTTTEH